MHEALIMDNPYKIKFQNGAVFNCAVQPVPSSKHFCGQYRDCLSIKITGSPYETISGMFLNGAVFSIMAYEEIPNVSGLPSREYEYVEYPKTDYIVAGDIIDHRDGTFTVLMGKKTALELLEEENAALLFENLTGEEF